MKISKNQTENRAEYHADEERLEAIHKAVEEVAKNNKNDKLAMMIATARISKDRSKLADEKAKTIRKAAEEMIKAR